MPIKKGDRLIHKNRTFGAGVAVSDEVNGLVSVQRDENPGSTVTWEVGAVTVAKTTGVPSHKKHRTERKKKRS